jgi:menaquinone-9 beta-reductase
MNDSFDILIIGAGPAGSTLAWRLARAGCRVALVDRKRFPRPKPCGEFLSPQCLPILEELGVRERIDALGAHRVTGMRLHGYGRLATGHYRDIGASAVPYGHGYAIQREVLDHELLKRAVAEDGVVFLEGWRCRGLIEDANGGVRGAHLVSPAGEDTTVCATWTVGADGVRSVVARELGVQKRIPWLDKFALTTHYAGVPAMTTAEVHIFPGGYFAAAPIDSELLSLNLVLDRLRLKDRESDWDAFFAAHVERLPALRLRLEGAKRVRPIRGVGPLAYRTTRQAADGAVLVGDACGYIDPMTGEGIYFALRTAAILAADLAVAVENGTRRASAVSRYVRTRRREIGPRLVLCKLLQRGLQRDAVAHRILSWLSHRPGLADLMVSVTGDYVRFRELLRPGVWWRAGFGGGTAC